MAWNDEQSATRRSVEAFDRAVAASWLATRAFARDVIMIVGAPLVRFRRRLRALATHTDAAASGVFATKAPDSEDHIGYQARFLEIARTPRPDRTEILELAEVVDGLADYGDNPLPRLVSIAEQPPIIIQTSPRPAGVQAFAGLPVPGLGGLWQVAAIGAAAAAAAGWGAYGYSQIVEVPSLERRVEANAVAVERLKDAVEANRTLAEERDTLRLERDGALRANAETVRRAAEQFAAAERRWRREQAAMMQAMDDARRAVDEARMGSSSRSNDEWLRDNGLGAVNPDPGGAPAPR